MANPVTFGAEFFEATSGRILGAVLENRRADYYDTKLASGMNLNLDETVDYYMLTGEWLALS